MPLLQAKIYGRVIMKKTPKKYLGGVIQMTVWDCQFKIERKTPKANDSLVGHFYMDHFRHKNEFRAGCDISN